MSALQLFFLVAVLRHAVVLVLRDVEEVDVAVLVLQQLRQLLQSTKSGESYECFTKCLWRVCEKSLTALPSA